MTACPNCKSELKIINVWEEGFSYFKCDHCSESYNQSLRKQVATKKSKNHIPFEWEGISLLEDESHLQITSRAKVFGGWAIINILNSQGNTIQSMIFVPDPNHEWEIN